MTICTIGQSAFKAIANLDSRFMLIWCDEKKHAIILCFLAKTPCPEKCIGVRLDLIARK
jgi:hypothetical protein